MTFFFERFILILNLQGFLVLTERARHLGKKTLGPAFRVGTASVLFLSSVSCSENKSPSGPDSLDNSQKTERQATDLEFPFASGKWYLTNGPHPDVEPPTGVPKVLSSLDFAPSKIIPCNNNEQDQVKWDKDWVTSPINGEVILVGDENNLQDKNHGLVEIKMDKEPSAEILMAHLTDLQIEEGEHVNVGDPLGHASCAHSPFATNTGVHAHEEFRINNIPLDISKARIVIAGEFEIKGDGTENAQGFYDGTLDGNTRKVIGYGGRSPNNLIPPDALLGSTSSDEPTEIPTQENGNRNFVSQELGFSTSLPDGWNMEVVSKNGKLQEKFDSPKTEDKSGASLEVTVEDTLGHDLEFYRAYVEVGFVGLRKLSVENDMGSPEDINVDKTSGKEWKGKIKIEGQGEYNLTYIIFIKNDKLWTISFTTVPDKNDFEGEFNNFIDNFMTN